MPEGQDSRSIRVLNPQAARGALRTRKGNSCAHLPGACTARLHAAPSTNRPHGWTARASLHNFLSSTSNDASCAGEAKRQGAKAWVFRTVPMILLLAGIGYSQDARAQIFPPCPTPTQPTNQPADCACNLSVPLTGCCYPPLSRTVAVMSEPSNPTLASTWTIEA